MVSPARRRDAVRHVTERLSVSERRGRGPNNHLTDGTLLDTHHFPANSIPSSNRTAPCPYLRRPSIDQQSSSQLGS